MICNGYYYPKEIYRDLRRYENGEVLGKAQMAICFGNRTGGKTVGHGIQMIKNFEERGETCMLLSRTAEQKKGGYLSNWWQKKIFNVDDDDKIIQSFVSNHDIEFSKDLIRVDGKDFSYCESISMSRKVKDEGAYNKCTTIIMDECVQRGERLLIIDGRTAMERIFEITQTVARGWDNAIDCTNMVFIANTSNRDNWLFNDMKINQFVREDTKYTCQNGIIVEIVMNESARKKVENSILGQIMRRSVSGEEYYESAQNNEFCDNKAFVVSRGLDFRRLVVQIISRGYCVGVFEFDGNYHISVITQDHRSPVITSDVEFHTERVGFQPYGGWIDGLRARYESGMCTFQTLESKGIFLEIIGYK